MHDTSYTEMGRHFVKNFKQDSVKTILDVGSCSVKDDRTYRKLILPNWKYTGCDLHAGDNVDLIMADEDHIPVLDDSFDIVISGQCLEHVRRPWVLVKEMARVLKRGGWMFVVAPFMWHVHRYPLDCWRFLPDGLQTILEDAGIQCTKAYINFNDCWGIGKKL